MRPPVRRNRGHDVIIVGGGMAGLTAAWHAARLGLSAILVERDFIFGGQLATIASVEGFPATGAVSGVDLATRLVEYITVAGVQIVHGEASGIEPDGRGFLLASEGQTYRGKAILVSSGARLRKLGVPGEAELAGSGVSHCADCDGALFRGRDTVVVGGGNAALHEALILAGFCKTVYIVVRGELRASRAYIDRARNKTNIQFVWDHAVEAIDGQAVVSGVKLTNVKTGERRGLPCSGVFVFIGTVPNTEFLPKSIRLDNDGRIVTNGAFQTSVPDVYAVGAVRSGYTGELVCATGEAVAAIRQVASANGA